MSTPSPPSPQPNAVASLRKAVRSFAALFFNGIRKSPVLLVSMLVLGLLYYRNPQTSQEQESGPPEFSEPTLTGQQRPPAELSPAQQSLWLCVQRVDAELMRGLWSDIYDGMEANLDGTAITVKVTEKWQDLSDGKRQTVGQLVVDTWLKTARTLEVFLVAGEMEETDGIVLKGSGQEFREAIFQRSPDDKIVALWQPRSGLLLLDSEAGA